MFRATPPNPYDEIVLKATDEAQTSENWSLFIQVCDKVIGDSNPTGPRDCIASIQKRLQHRNANVQLFCLTLTESLVKNTNENLHKEVSSRAFMKVLSGLVLDRYTHENVKTRILQCLISWADEFRNKPHLGLVEETVDELKEKGHQYKEEQSTSSHPPDDILKREEEELQRALAESEREAEWMNMAGVGNFPPATLNSQSNIGPTGYIPSSSQARFGNPPLANNPPNEEAYTTSNSIPPPHNAYQPLTQAMAQISLKDSRLPTDDVPLGPPTGAELYPVRTKGRPAPRRVKALYDFEPNEEGELPFKEGDVIRVIDSVYKDWWKGELRGQIGIFPVNYIETIPDPSPEALAREAEVEASVFAQACEIDRLLQMMQTLDAKKDNLADNDELSELYQRTLSLRPKIVRLIEKYTQKKAELLQINSKFMKAKTTYDAMIEESLALHHPGVAAEAFTQPNPNYRPPNTYVHQAPYTQTSYGIEQTGYPVQQPPLSHYQHQPPILPASSAHHPQYPTVTVPEGIDTSRYYLASDGNWYAYSAEHPAPHGTSGLTPPTNPMMQGSPGGTESSSQPPPPHHPQPSLTPIPSSHSNSHEQSNALGENSSGFHRQQQQQADIINPAWPAYPPNSSSPAVQQ